MWTREQLKFNAKGRLRFYYWSGVLACLIAGFLGGGVSGGVGFQFDLFQYDFSGFDGLFGRGDETQVEIVMILLAIYLIILALVICYSLFVSMVVQVGLNRFFMENREHKASLAVVFSGFKGNYLNVVKVQFFTQLSIFLWTLLLIVPGIIKSYEYFFVPYLLAENPNMDVYRAKELSRQMTDGEKWRIFVLGLSFIGWELLAAFTCGIGSIFLAPYIQATFAELYEAMREKVLAQRMALPEELPGFSYSL